MTRPAPLSAGLNAYQKCPTSRDQTQPAVIANSDTVSEGGEDIRSRYQRLKSMQYYTTCELSQ